MREDPLQTLRRSRYIDQRIRELQEEYRELQERMDSLNGTDYAKPIVKSSAGRGSVEKMAIAAADSRAKIIRETTKLLAAKEEARSLIGLLPDGPEKSVLAQRYLLLREWEEIAEATGYSYRHVTRLHGQAIQELRKRCP